MTSKRSFSSTDLTAHAARRQPPRPAACSTDRTAPHALTLALAPAGPPPPSPAPSSSTTAAAAAGGPVDTLVHYAARTVARHLDSYDSSVWQDGPSGVGLASARAVVRALCLAAACEAGEEAAGTLETGNWVRFVGGYGMGVLPCPPPLLEDGHAAPLHQQQQLTLRLPLAELVHALTASPPSHALLALNHLPYFAPPPSRALDGGAAGSVLTVLDVSHSGAAFGDAECRAVRWLAFLTALDTSWTGLTDGDVRFLASCLDATPSSASSHPAAPSAAPPSNSARAPEHRGLHALRAWSLKGCKGVTDRSALSFAKWARLEYLDVRQTSVHPQTFRQILNRTAAAARAPAGKYTACPARLRSQAAGGGGGTTLLADARAAGALGETASAAVCTIATRAAPSASGAGERVDLGARGKEAAEDVVFVRRLLPPGPPAHSTAAPPAASPAAARTRLQADHSARRADGEGAPPRSRASRRAQDGALLDGILAGVGCAQPAAARAAPATSSSLASPPAAAAAHTAGEVAPTPGASGRPRPAAWPSTAPAPVERDAARPARSGLSRVGKWG